MSSGSKNDTLYDSDIQLEDRQEIDYPSMYRVILHNDDYTTMEFVINILTSIFHMPEQKATKIMLDVHKKGKGECGFYTYDIAVTKVNQVHELAKENGFPLKASYEKT